MTAESTTASDGVATAPGIRESQRSSPPPVSLRSLVFRGSVWTLGGHATGQFLRFVSSLVLARLLPAQAFGIMFIVTSVITGLKMFSEVGIAPSIIRDERGDDAAFLNTAWTIQLGRSVLLFCISCLLAWPIAWLYADPEYLAVTIWLIPVAAVGTLIGGFFATSVPTLRRHLVLWPLEIWGLVAIVIQVAVNIIAAFILRNVWALVIGGVIAAAVQLLLSHTWLRTLARPYVGRLVNRPLWETAAARELIRFGRWIFIATALTYFVRWGDKLIVGAVFTNAQMGSYAIAFLIYMFIYQGLLRLSSGVLMPLYSKIAQQAPETLRPRMRRVRINLLLAFLPCFCGLSLLGDVVIDFLYPAEKFPDAGWILQVLCAGGAFAAITSTTSPVLIAMGDSFRLMLYQAATALVMTAAMVIGGQMAGQFGWIFGYAFAPLMTYPLLGWAVGRYGVWMPRLDLTAMLATTAVIAGGHVILSGGLQAG